MSPMPASSAVLWSANEEDRSKNSYCLLETKLFAFSGIFPRTFRKGTSYEVPRGRPLWLFTNIIAGDVDVDEST